MRITLTEAEELPGIINISTLLRNRVTAVARVPSQSYRNRKALTGTEVIMRTQLSYDSPGSLALMIDVAIGFATCSHFHYAALSLSTLPIDTNE